MYAILMTALVSVDAQTQTFCFRQRSSCSRPARASCGCGGYVSYGCYGCSCSGCGGCWSAPSCSYVVCGGCSANVCCGAWSPCSGCFVSTPVSTGCYGCSMPWAGGSVIVHDASPSVIYGSAPSAPFSASSAPFQTDPSLTPASEAEKQAVRDALKSAREKKSAPTNPLSPPIPGLNPKLDVPPPPGLSAQAKVTIRVPENAKLWVDDVMCPLEGEVRTFNVPNLQQGLEYAYSVRIEVELDGKMATEERQVLFAAGRTVEVDFAANGSLTARR
ncbi:MAG: TIGR03000 domain-containing protein [Gemmataceae bacterium]|nr:TIGR03000 domain-containing protein [Gemmataceae bacterium]